MVEIEIYLPRVFRLKISSNVINSKKEDVKTVQVNKNVFYFELISKPNVYILDITVSMCKQHDFENVFTSNYVTNIYNLGLDK